MHRGVHPVRRYAAVRQCRAPVGPPPPRPPPPFWPALVRLRMPPGRAKSLVLLFAPRACPRRLRRRVQVWLFARRSFCQLNSTQLIIDNYKNRLNQHHQDHDALTWLKESAARGKAAYCRTAYLSSPWGRGSVHCGALTHSPLRAQGPPKQSTPEGGTQRRPPVVRVYKEEARSLARVQTASAAVGGFFFFFFLFSSFLSICDCIRCPASCSVAPLFGPSVRSGPVRSLRSSVCTCPSASGQAGLTLVAE